MFKNVPGPRENRLRRMHLQDESGNFGGKILGHSEDQVRDSGYKEGPQKFLSQLPIVGGGKIMDVKNVNILYACIYCRRRLTSEKTRVVDHLTKGCSYKQKKCTHTLLVEASPLTCYVYLNEKNCHLDVRNDLLHHIRFPEVKQYFTTQNEWKSVRTIEDPRPFDSEEDNDY